MWPKPTVLCLLSLFASGACDKATLTFEDDPCFQTRCVSEDADDLLDPGREEEAHLTEIARDPPSPVWQRDLSCTDDLGCGLSGRTAWHVDPDGSITAAYTYQFFPLETEPQHRGVVVYRFDPSGAEVWRKEILHLRSSEPGGTPCEIALAGDEDAGVLISIAVPKNTGARPDTRVLAISAEAEVRALFVVHEVQTHAIAAFGGDVLILGDDWDQELGRYRRNGDVVWRQAALLSERDTPELWTSWPSPVKLMVDGSGVARLTLASVLGFMLIEVGPDGVVRSRVQVAENSEDEPLLKRSQLARDSSDRVIVGVDAYRVVRCPASGCSVRDRGELQYASRERTEYYPTNLFGLSLDADDRMYVLTQLGDRDQSQYAIDRIDTDFSTRETFMFDKDALPGPPIALEVRQDAIYVLSSRMNDTELLDKRATDSLLSRFALHTVTK